MESIIVLRICAIAGRRRVLLGFFCCLLCLNVAATLAVSFRYSPVLQVGDEDVTFFSW